MNTFTFVGCFWSEYNWQCVLRRVFIDALSTRYWFEVWIQEASAAKSSLNICWLLIMFVVFISAWCCACLVGVNSTSIKPVAGRHKCVSVWTFCFRIGSASRKMMFVCLQTDLAEPQSATRSRRVWLQCFEQAQHFDHVVADGDHGRASWR